jgi:acetyl-CoA acyltransferase
MFERPVDVGCHEADGLGGPQVVGMRGRVALAWASVENGVPDRGLLGRTNVNGGAIATGHPLGASGARIMTTLVNPLEQRGGRYGLQTMCEGGGMANATIIERLG